MAFQLLDEIISSCAELHSLLSVCSPEEVDMEDMNDHLQKLLPMIPCEKSSNIGMCGESVDQHNLNKENSPQETVVSLHLHATRHVKKLVKPEPGKVDGGEWVKRYEFGLVMEKEV